VPIKRKNKRRKKRNSINDNLGITIFSFSIIGVGAFFLGKYIYSFYKGSTYMDPASQDIALRMGSVGKEVKELQKHLNFYDDYFCAFYNDRNWNFVNGQKKINLTGKWDQPTQDLYKGIQKAGSRFGGYNGGDSITLNEIYLDRDSLSILSPLQVCP